jgi:hypothetical protein
MTRLINPSSGQATTGSQLRHLKHHALPFKGSVRHCYACVALLHRALFLSANFHGGARGLLRVH